MYKKPLIIGISGKAGSGKDTVKDMISVYYNYKPTTLNEFKDIYKTKYSSNTVHEYPLVTSVAFADKLKEICSIMYDIDINLFYDRISKENNYINLTTHELVTRSESVVNKSVTAEEYYYNQDVSTYKDYYMSLRELMVFTGTYLIRYNLDNKFFINAVNNFINKNYNREVIIVSDVRFSDEFAFIQEKHGVSILVRNNRITPLNNIAEGIENEEQFDFEINNDGTFDELLEKVYNMLTNHIIYKNIQLNIFNVTLRLISQTSLNNTYELLISNNEELTNTINGISFDECTFADDDFTLIDKINSITVNNAELFPTMKIDNNLYIDTIYRKVERFYLTTKKL